MRWKCEDASFRHGGLTAAGIMIGSMGKSVRHQLTLAIVSLLLISGLIFYKTRASLPVFRSAWTNGVISSRPMVVSFGSQASTVNAFNRSINYFIVIGPALIFGILIGAA